MVGSSVSILDTFRRPLYRAPEAAAGRTGQITPHQRKCAKTMAAGGQQR